MRDSELRLRVSASLHRHSSTSQKSQENLQPKEPLYQISAGHPARGLLCRSTGRPSGQRSPATDAIGMPSPELSGLSATIIFLVHAHLRQWISEIKAVYGRDPQPYFQDCTSAPWLVSWNAGTGRPGQMPGVDDGQCGGDRTEHAWSLHLVCPFRASTMLRYELRHCQADLLQIPYSMRRVFPHSILYSSLGRQART